MAISKSLFTRGLNQRVGGAVFYQQAGRTLVRELAAEVSNPRTISQMNNRIKWANLVNFYKVSKGWMKRAYEGKKATQSDYNVFMSKNVSSSKVVLTKSEAVNNACIVEAYRVSQGSLPPIEFVTRDTHFVSNIVCPIPNLDGTQTVSVFSRELLESNPGLRHGDQLSFIRYTQQVSNAQGIYYLTCRVYEVILDTENTKPLSEYLPMQLINTTEISGIMYLRVMNNGNNGAFAMVCSRTTSGKTAVSSQNLIIVNNQPIINEFSSAKHIEEAMASYGGGNDVFLDSTRANTSDAEPSGILNLMSVSVLGKTYYDNYAFISESAMNHQNVTAHFNKRLTGISTVSAKWYLGPNERTANATINGNDVTFTPSETNPSSYSVDKIVIVLDGTSFEMNFTEKGGDIE